MNDELLLTLAQSTARLLKRMEFHEDADKLIPSYNAVLTATKANHPDNVFLNSLEPLEGKINKNQLEILFTQLGIVLNALLERDEIVEAE